LVPPAPTAAAMRRRTGRSIGSDDDSIDLTD
jgi:hypothetical protein